MTIIYLLLLKLLFVLYLIAMCISFICKMVDPQGLEP